MLLIIATLGIIYAGIVLANELEEKSESERAKEEGYEVYFYRY